MSRIRYLARLVCATVGWLAFSAVVQATTVADLTDLPLEDLMKIELTTAAKRPEALVDTPAAAFVITAEDIKRSGALSIPEALRMAPGVEVARINAHSWAITSRGFNSRFANKLLVLIDGRAVYTPFFSGVFWNRQDTIMENIERIEVIRGPGAALWGANAVNGVINIITKDAADTQGNAGSLAYSTENDRILEHTYGSTLGDAGHYRVFAKYYDISAKDTADGYTGFDSTEVMRTGFRSDLKTRNDDEITLIGDYASGYTSDEYSVASLTAPFSSTHREDSETNSAYFLGRWSRRLSDVSDVQVQVYYDYNKWNEERFSERRNIADIEAQHTTLIGGNNEIVWGGGVRRNQDRLSNSFTASFTPVEETTYLYNAFFQDTISLLDDDVAITLGTRIEHNDYTGFEYQPSLRGRWHVDSRNTLWAGVSRAVRTPSRSERSVTANSIVIPPFSPGNPTALPAAVPVVGSDNTEAEDVTAYEIGYRTAPTRNLTLDSTAFYNVYDAITGVFIGPTTVETTPVMHTRTPLIANSGNKGETLGVEIAVDYKPAPKWRLRGSYSYLYTDFRARDDVTVAASEGASPQQQARFWVQTDLADDVALDIQFRYVDRLPALEVDDYFTADARIGWKISDNLEVSLIGRNLLQNGHTEFNSEAQLPAISTVATRQVYGMLSWKF